jgi:mRNA-degrading endonuclease toxin of MazEF toxin-antitoxin module
VQDKDIRRLPEEGRTAHETRPIVIISGNAVLASDPDFEVVLVAPVTSDLNRTNPDDDLILEPSEQSTRSLVRRSRVVLSLTQPLLKRLLLRHIGQMDPNRLILKMFGILKSGRNL